MSVKNDTNGSKEFSILLTWYTVLTLVHADLFNKVYLDQWSSSQAVSYLPI